MSYQSISPGTTYQLQRVKDPFTMERSDKCHRHQMIQVNTPDTRTNETCVGPDVTQCEGRDLTSFGPCLKCLTVL